MTLDDNGLEVLDVPTCRALLATTHLGRVALSRQALPIVVPVVFTLSGGTILIPAVSALVRRAAHSGDVICFEADAHDSTGALWSVLVTGPLATTGRGTSGQLEHGWSTTAVELVSLHASLLSGRRTTLPARGLARAPAEDERSCT